MGMTCHVTDRLLSAFSMASCSEALNSFLEQTSNGVEVGPEAMESAMTVEYSNFIANH